MHNAGMIYGYARVSTDAQDLSNQAAQLKAAGCAHHSIVEMIMKLRLLIVLACTLLAISACIVGPYGGGHGGDYRGGEGGHDYGRRVWH